MQRVGIDLGGTKIEALVLNDEGRELVRVRVPTPRSSYDELLDTLQQLVEQCQRESGVIERIGIGLPGAISPDSGRVKNANLQILNGQDLVRDLGARFTQPVSLANDADCLALSEFHDGSAASAQNSCFAAILGTGCGGGVIANGRLVCGPNRIAGEWGHNPLPGYRTEVDGRVIPCYCGRPACQESFISGSGFSGTFNRKYATDLKSETIISLMRDGDERAVEHFELYCDQLARAFAAIINILDPEVIVVGGGFSNVDEIYQRVPELWTQYVFSDSVHTKLKKALHGDSSGVRGAAWL
ncbi:ROK family protein [Dongshaea marina]|uniref:ROK family protein n=1 Tax=Dongshaea marina TaxID=2047966 RepID=UPI000D3E5313|nr:ROK family protein [Dongshaea marina]